MKTCNSPTETLITAMEGIDDIDSVVVLQLDKNRRLKIFSNEDPLKALGITSSAKDLLVEELTK